MIEGHGGGEGEEALAEPDAQSVEGARAVAFQAEHVFGRPEDRLDALADGSEMWSAGGLVLAGGPDEVRVEGADGGGEGAADIALVADHEFAAGARAAGDQFGGDVALVALGRGQC